MSRVRQAQQGPVNADTHGTMGSYSLGGESHRVLSVWIDGLCTDRDGFFALVTSGMPSHFELTVGTSGGSF